MRASTSGIPIGHISWNFGKKYLSFSQVLQFVKANFQNKMLSRATCELYWSWTLWMLWCKYHYVKQRWRIWIGGKYLSYGATWWIGDVSSNFRTFIFERTWFDLKFLWKIKILSTRQLKGNFWCWLSHWKAQKSTRQTKWRWTHQNEPLFTNKRNGMNDFTSVKSPHLGIPH